MRCKAGNICIFLGTALVFGALILFLHNQQEACLAREASSAHLEQLVKLINNTENNSSQDTSGEDGDSPMDYFVPEIPEELLTAKDLEMSEVVVDGNSYIGYLTLPTLNLELPILSDWDEDLLQIAPCRYYGTLRGNDLVLMAHNYSSHFGKISRLRQGDPVVFVDVDGHATRYEVVAQDILGPYSGKELTSGKFDLALFTCTYSGKRRVAVYCDRAS